MALSDMYELRLKSRFGLQVGTLNVFHCQRASAVYGADEVATAFFDTVIPKLLLAQSSTMVYEELEVYSLGDPADFFTLDLGAINGSISGEVLPAFNSVGTRFLRTRRDIRHGYKRFAGIPEAHQNGGVLTSSAALLWQAVADAIVADWEITADPGITVANFAVILRVCAEIGPLGVCIKWRLPETDAELEFYLPEAAVLANVITHQTTRRATT